MSGLGDDIRAIVRDGIDAGAIGGAVVLVQRDGAVADLQAQGCAEFDPRFALRTDSVFGVMSMTKPVAAACALALVEEGRLALDAPVADYVPSFARPREVRTLAPGESYPPFPPLPGAPPPPPPRYRYAPAARPITVRHILAFTSGLQTIGVPNDAPVPAPGDTLESFVPRLDRIPLEFQPGTQWHYSNMTGYDVLGRLVEVASGQRFQDFARERLFGPLGMRRTGFGIDPALAGEVVPLGFLADTPVVRPDYPSGSGGLFSTAEDYARFAQLLLDGGCHQGAQLLPEAAVCAMHTPQIGALPFGGIRGSDYARPVHAAASPFTYGFGVGILARPSPEESVPVGSYGWDGIASRRFWVMPALRTILVMLMPGVGPAAEPTHRRIEAAVVRWAAG